MLASLVFICAACAPDSRETVATPEAETSKLARDAVDAFRRNAAPAVVFSRTAGAPDEPTDAIRSQIGGVPGRLNDAMWPTSDATGEPLIFIGQIARDVINQELMGSLQLVQVFADVRYFHAELDGREGFFVRTHTVDEPSQPGAWDDAQLQAVIELLQAAFEERLSGQVHYLDGRAARLGDLSAYNKAHDLAYERWGPDTPREVIDKAFEALWSKKPEMFLTENTSVLGGNPMWIQGEATSHLPFFLQMVTDGDVMIGDGGNLYVFLDPDNPGLGYEVEIQMY